jgi:WD40 repeat protein
MADRVGQQLGNYRLLRLIGQGGFGEVYLGEHVYLQRQAAIKVLSVRLEKEDMEGFLNEARTIARLEHPNIVQVLEFGVESGIPFLVMSYAPNGTLRQRHPRGTTLPIPAMVSYVKQVADALQYAHDEKLIHRDVKPENMLLGRRNEVLLSDFGIALIAQSTSSQSKQEVVGTVAYMAPEQIQGKPRPASDQYALGIVVYEWLSGDRPFHGSFTEIATQHLFVPPPPLHEKTPKISPDIEQVVMTALAKDPQQRFKNVRAFATALEQACLSAQDSPTALESQPLLPTVAAIPPSQHIWPAVAIPSESQISQPGVMNTSPIELQRTGGVSRRTVVTGLAGLAIVGVVGSGLAWLRLSHSSSGPAAKPTPARTSTSIPTTTPTRALTPPATPVPPGTLLMTYQGHSSWMTTARWSPNNKYIASGSADMTVQVWDSTTGNTLQTYRGHSDIVVSAEWSPNGMRIASSGNDRTVQVWDSITGGNVFTYRAHSNTVYDVAWSPDGTRIASCSWDNTVQIWNAVTGTLHFTYHGHSGYVFSVAWSPDGRWIGSGSADNTPQVWDATNGNTLYTYHGHSDYVGKVVWSPDSTRIASGSRDKTVHVWEATTGSNTIIYRGHSDEVSGVAWSPKGRLIASSGADRTVQIWEAQNGSTVFTYRGHSAKINALGWSPDGTRIVSGDDAVSVQVWQAV